MKVRHGTYVEKDESEYVVTRRDLLRHIDKLERELAKALADGAAQSELIQHEWASPYELAGLKDEIERLREQVRIETDEAMAQNARADHLAADLAEIRHIVLWTPKAGKEPDDTDRSCDPRPAE
jgi:hypothetical protein